MKEWMNEWIYGCITFGWMNGWIHGCIMDEWMDDMDV